MKKKKKSALSKTQDMVAGEVKSMRHDSIERKDTKGLLERIDAYLSESTGEYCHFFKAKDRKWYFLLGPDEYNTVAYGPFNSEEEADKYLLNHHGNPGGWNTDDTGKKPAPRNPHKDSGNWMRY